MEPDKKNINKENEDITDRYDYLANAASTQDCTGLIPANPYPEVMETYEEVFHYEPPKLKVERE